MSDILDKVYTLRELRDRVNVLIELYGETSRTNIDNYSVEHDSMRWIMFDQHPKLRTDGTFGQDDLDNAFERGRDDGHSVGFDDGHKDGYNEGFNRGKVEGEESGRNLGYKDGYSEGYDEGYTNCLKANGLE